MTDEKISICSNKSKQVFHRSRCNWWIQNQYWLRPLWQIHATYSPYPGDHPSALPDGERVLVCLQVIYVLGIPLEADGRRELHVQFGRLLPGLARVGVVQREALEQLPIVPRKGDMQDNMVARWL